jgi:hypothetical protein
MDCHWNHIKKDTPGCDGSTFSSDSRPHDLQLSTETMNGPLDAEIEEELGQQTF